MKTGLAVVMVLLLSSCASNNGNYIDVNGNLYTGVSDNAAYNMAVRDTYLGETEAFITGMKEMRDNHGGQIALGMAYAYNQARGPQFQKSKDWVDRTMQLYPLIRDLLSITVNGIPVGFGEGAGNSTALDSVMAGRDIYINSQRRDQYDLASYSSFQANESPAYSFDNDEGSDNTDSWNVDKGNTKDSYNPPTEDSWNVDTTY